MKSTLIFSLLLITLFAASPVHAQSTPDKRKHKVVFQLASSDTLVHKALVKQLHNVQKAAPNTKIEVVCHNNGISFLTTNATRHAGDIVQLKAAGVDFVACENTMQTRNLKREDLVPECRTVPAGLLEIIDKQERGWAYIKAGF